MVKSISCPTPLTMGIDARCIARATTSSLKAQRSSSDPPPRVRMSTSHSGRPQARSIIRAIASAAPAPWTGTGWITTGTAGNRRPSTLRTVAHRRAGGGGDHPDAPRQRGEGELVRGIEQAFRAEPALQRIERAPQRPGARLLHVLHDELELAALGVEADLRMGEHLHAVVRRESQRSVVHAEHRAPHLAALVLEREVDVPGARAREVGDLALDPDGRERLLENRTGVEVEARHRVDVAGEGVRGGGQARIGHAAMLPRPAGNDKGGHASMQPVRVVPHARGAWTPGARSTPPCPHPRRPRCDRSRGAVDVSRRFRYTDTGTSGWSAGSTRAEPEPNLKENEP